MSGDKRSEVSQRTAQTMSKLQTAIDQCTLLPRDRLAKSKDRSLLIRETGESIEGAKIGQKRR